MKRILCFGDSNTFGYDPSNGFRFPKEIRWTGVLQELCGNTFEIIEGGCNNRTCFRDNPEGEKFTGYKALPKLLETNPDIAILAIGTNDLQRIYRTSEQEIKFGIENLIEIAKKQSPNTEIILVATPPIGQEVLLSGIFAFLFDKSSIEKSQQLGKIYQQVSEQYGCKFLDLAPYITPSKIDGLHFDKEGHKKVAELLFQIIAN